MKIGLFLLHIQQIYRTIEQNVLVQIINQCLAEGTHVNSENQQCNNVSCNLSCPNICSVVKPLGGEDTWWCFSGQSSPQSAEELCKTLMRTLWTQQPFLCPLLQPSDLIYGPRLEKVQSDIMES